MTFVAWLLAVWKELCFVVVVESWERGVRFRRGIRRRDVRVPGMRISTEVKGE